MNEALFTRTDTPQGVRFDVTPAPAVKTQGCMVMVGYGFSALVALWGLGGGIPGLLLSSLIWGPVLAATVFLGRHLSKEPPRKAVSLLVNEDGINVGGRHYAASDIVEFQLKLPGDDGGVKYEVYPSSGSATFGRLTAQRAKNRSYALMARMRSISRPEIIVFGLTWNTGEALMNDVSEAMK
jgi:hypothetical protein